LSQKLCEAWHWRQATGAKHAGEDLAEVLRQRSGELPPPIQMCDLESLGEVYGYDEAARERGMMPDERPGFHQAHSGPVMEKLRAWLNAQFDERKAEQNSGLGTAISYLLNHWDRLTLFLRQPGSRWTTTSSSGP
jgi:hypothetical protein